MPFSSASHVIIFLLYFSLSPFGGAIQLLNVGKADISIKNKDGQTPLVKGYMLLYKQPPESYVRAVVLLEVHGMAALLVLPQSGGRKQLWCAALRPL